MGICDRPYEYFQIARDLPKVLPAAVNYLPLWEVNCEAITALDTNRDVYVRVYYEDAKEKILGVTYQQFVTGFLLELADADFWEELDNIAEMFAYKHMEELKQHLAEDLDWPEARRQFIESITD